jgi:hypothetical protein
MEIAISGEGEVIIRFIDRDGATLLQERVTIAGPEGVRAVRNVSLSIGTVGGRAQVVPVLIAHGHEQRVTFDGEPAAQFVRRRCREIGCTARVTRDAARGLAPALLEVEAGVVSSTEPSMTELLRVAADGTRPPRSTRTR